MYYFHFLTACDSVSSRPWPSLSPRIFTEEEIADLRKVRLWDIIVNATDVDSTEVQHDVFFWKPDDPCPQPLQLNTSLLEPCQFLKGYDYFEVHCWKKSFEKCTPSHAHAPPIPYAWTTCGRATLHC